MFLRAPVIEIFGRQPVEEGLANRRPIGIDDCIPGGVAIAFFVNGGLPEDSLEGKAEAESGGAGRGVEGIAFPFDTTVSQVEGVRDHEIHGLGRGSGALKKGREIEVPDLDRSAGRLDAHQAGHTGSAVGFRIDNGVEQRIIFRGHFGDPVLVILERSKRTIGKISPIQVLGIESVGFEKIASVQVGIEANQTAVASFDWVPWWRVRG